MPRYFNILALFDDFTTDISLVYDEGRLRIVKGKYNYIGNPSRIVRYRFSKELIEELLSSKWREKPIEEIKPLINEFQQPYEKFYFSKHPKKNDG